MIEDDARLHQSKLFNEYLKWRETGHDITYQQWLEICLVVERDNAKWMNDQWKLWQKNIMNEIMRLCVVDDRDELADSELTSERRVYLKLAHIKELVKKYAASYWQNVDFDLGVEP